MREPTFEQAAVPPGPKGDMSLTEALDLQRDTLGFVMRTMRAHGDFVKQRIGFWDVYLVSHPDAVQHIFVDNWRNYGRNTFQFDKFSMVTGRGMLTTDGDYWQRHRRLAQPGFHRRALGGMADQMVAAVWRMVGRWVRIAASEDPTVDVDAEMLRLALEIVSAALFSLDVTAEAAELSQEMLHMMEYVVYRSQNLLAPPAWVPTPRNWRFRRSLSRLDERIYTLIAQRRRMGDDAPDDLLQLLLTAEDEHGRPLPDEEVRDEAVTLIIAGYETVASGMSWIWHTLGHHPAVAAQVRAEVDRVLGGRWPTMADMGDLPYMHQVIDEVFRLYPPSWLVTRRALADDVVAGYKLPAGSLVVVSPYAVHRHPDFWPDAERFDPGRFSLDADRHRYAYIPFGGGPHLCIGRPFALLEAGVTVAGVIGRFEMELVGETAVRPQVTLRPENGLRVRLARR